MAFIKLYIFLLVLHVFRLVLLFLLMIVVALVDQMHFKYLEVYFAQTVLFGLSGKQVWLECLLCRFLECETCFMVNMRHVWLVVLF